MRITAQAAMRLTDEACQLTGEDFYLIPGQLETFDFDLEDFTGAVVLSIEEANLILQAMNPGPKDTKWRDLLEERIEQAKKEKE